MLKELDELINFIQTEYIQLTNKWEQSGYYIKINLKNNQVYDLLENKTMLDNIVNYREFLNQNNIQLMMDFKKFNTDNATINIRTKAKNSIEFKIENYIKNHEDGKIPINKCFNDLFGIRIICNEELSFDKIVKLINNKYSNIEHIIVNPIPNNIFLIILIILFPPY